MEPYKIYDFEDEKAWLKGRLNGIGGSDASAVVGKNPYKTNIELFEEKTGRRIAPDISEKRCITRRGAKFIAVSAAWPVLYGSVRQQEKGLQGSAVPAWL